MSFRSKSRSRSLLGNHPTSDTCAFARGLARCECFMKQHFTLSSKYASDPPPRSYRKGEETLVRLLDAVLNFPVGRFKEVKWPRVTERVSSVLVVVQHQRLI